MLHSILICMIALALCVLTTVHAADKKEEKKEKVTAAKKVELFDDLDAAVLLYGRDVSNYAPSEKILAKLYEKPNPEDFLSPVNKRVVETKSRKKTKVTDILDDGNSVKSVKAYNKRIHQVGTASWYGPRFYGRKTASGEIFTKHQLTAAHRTLPFGTKLLVTNTKTGESVVVKVNDRGPFHGNRIIDLSHAAAERISLLKAGVCKVTITKL